MSTKPPAAITIAELGHLGDGVALDGAGAPIFVPGALPGEVVAFDPNAGPARILTPSPSRIKPVCPHARSCGGCLMQHGADALLADWKQGIVEKALLAHGLKAPLRAMHSSPARTRRRAVFSGRRTKKGVLVGFHQRAADNVIALSDCHVVAPSVFASKPALEALVLAGGSRKGELKLSVTSGPEGLDVSVMGGKPIDRALMTELADIAGRFDLARLSWDDEVITMARAPVQQFGRAKVTPPPGSFLQATPDAEAVMVADMREAVSGADAVVDLFAGSGTFSLPLAEQADVWALEGEAAMMQALDAAWRMTPDLHQLRVETRDLFRRPVEPIELKKIDAAVIDPPRAGAAAQVAALATSKVSLIGFVSCNPVTFARDAKVLVDAGFTLDWVRVIDQFRWSNHVELVARLSR